ncbi:PefC/AfrB family outer membrane usher protein [Escherichia coli]|uniref:PefC/AfrB family outer membrane usher protein n=1 Tax=Escherichia coli TaxID=562 RepID=UPI001401E816|nr:PefC/AfrB family outer membrane usher protein [Escherichia coli]
MKKPGLTKIYPKLSLLALSLYSHYSLGTEFNTSFLINTQEVPSLFNENIDFPSGEYLVDVQVNGDRVGKNQLLISREDEERGLLCLSPAWLKESGVRYRPESYAEVYDKERNCYNLANEENTKVEFRYSQQMLAFHIPQAHLLEKADPLLWDYGDTGLRVSYSGNFNRNNNDELSSYGSFRVNGNLGKWVLMSNMNASRYDGESKFSTSDLSLSRAIGAVRGDLTIGRSQVQSELFTNFGFYGVSLASNSRMTQGYNTGYAPVISGVASSTSRITIEQNNYTVYSRVVPAGPYVIDDLGSVSNGDLKVTTEDANGVKTVRIYPVSTLPSLLRPGETRYNVAVGKKQAGTELKDALKGGDSRFMLGSMDHGFDTTTLNTAGVVAENYAGAGIGFTQMLGNYGALSASVNASSAKYKIKEETGPRNGQSLSLKYAKSFTSNTNLQLLTYRYRTKGYTEFSEFDPYSPRGLFRQKSRYEARLSHSWDDVYLNVSYWQQDYWNIKGKTIGGDLSLSTMIFDKASMFVSGSYTKDPNRQGADYSVSLGVSVPFNFMGQNYYSNSSVGRSSDGRTMFNSGFSGFTGDRLNYSANVSADNHGQRGATASMGYAFDRMQTNWSVSKMGNNTNLSGSVSGSVIATPKTGLLFTKQASDTVAIVKLKDVPGVRFNGSMPTNSSGETVVYLNSYQPNTIQVNGEDLPDAMEMESTSWNVVPTENAIIYKEFTFKNIKRYILHLKDVNGNPLPGGDAKTEQGLNAGFVSSQGVLIMDLLAEPQKVTVSMSGDKACSFSAAPLKYNTNKVQEVRCE